MVRFGIIGLVTNPYKEGEARACENWMLGSAGRTAIGTNEHNSNY